jgi:transcriptional regulator with XRE-family HTH domain
MSITEQVISIRNALNKRKETRAEISEKANVNPHWLEKFAQGVITNPTLDRVAKVEAFLNQSKQ